MANKPTRRRVGFIAAIAALVLTVLIAIGLRYMTSQDSPISFAKPPALIDRAALESLPKKSASSADLTRIASSVLPPTNSWISGAILQTNPNPVYPMPLSFLPSAHGFEIGLPTITSSATTISGPHVAGLRATIADATTFSLTRFDKVSATLTYTSGQSTLGALTLAEGSPFVFYRAESQSTLKLTGTSTMIGNSSPTYLRMSRDGHHYVVATYDGASLTREGDMITISASPGSLVTLYALPDASSDKLREFAGNELTNVTTSFKTDSRTSLTTLAYHTTGDKPTVFVPMSYSEQSDQENMGINYQSIYGSMPAAKGTSFTLSTPLLEPNDSLDVSRLSSDEKDSIITSLRKDIAATSIDAQDSYFAGKGLARAANLLKLAEQLNQKEESAKLIALLKFAFASRLGGIYFYYDTALHGIAAKTAAFGSEDFNDHHFHYGYFLYAASILASYDRGFLDTYRNQINLLAADIASYAATSEFPVQRNYDPYAQHSWAAGIAPFADGNNQESSSEAINAWNGAALWGKVTNNTALQASATWMLSNESFTAQQAWRAPSSGLETPYLKAYTSPVSSLNFGGKRTYSTFFTDEAGAKLAIQLIPMVPVMQQFAENKDTITSSLTKSIKNDDYNVTLGDYALMYLALADPAKARGLLPAQTTIDDGNSLSYLKAWIFSQGHTSLNS
ncbi:MAG: glycosyl hydrolase [Candidatus Saccharimonas sp.]